MSMRRAFLFSFGRTGGRAFLQFLTNIALARLLAPAEMGLFAIALAAIMVLTALREFGTVRYLIKERDLTPDRLRSAYGVSLTIGIGLAGLLFLGRDLLAGFYGAADLAPILGLLAIGFVFVPFGQIALGLMRRDERHATLAGNTLVSIFAGSVVSVSCALAGLGATSMAYGYLVSEFALTALSLKAEPRPLRIRPSFTAARELLGFGLITSAGGIVNRLALYAPILLIGRLLDFEATGFFQRGFSLVQMIVAMLNTSTNWVTGAAMGARARAGQDISGIALSTTAFLTVIGWPALALLAFKAETLIVFLYGSAWQPAAALLMPLCIANAIALLASQNVGAYEGTGATWVFLRNGVLSLIITVVFTVIGALQSFEMVAWMRVPALTLTTLIHLHALNTLAGVTARGLFDAVRAALLVTLGIVAALCAMLLLEPAVETGSLADIGVLGLEVAVLAVLYPGLLTLTGHPLAGELRRVFDKVRKRI